MYIPFLNTIRTDIYQKTGIEVGVGINDVEFDNWVNSKKPMVEEFNTITGVIPNSTIINQFRDKYVYPGHNQCHMIAKMIYDINPKFEFYSGVVYWKNHLSGSLPFYYHSFNVFNGEIHDFSKLDSYEKPIVNSNFPQIYYGIKIPKEILEQSVQEGYLLDYFKESV